MWEMAFGFVLVVICLGSIGEVLLTGDCRWLIAAFISGLVLGGKS
jgi:hypothetical protein